MPAMHLRRRPPASAPIFGGRRRLFLLAAMSLASIVSALAIPAKAIDHDLARGLHDLPDGAARQVADRDQPSGLECLFSCRPLMIFAACVVLFHFANAAMLPLVGQKLALQDQDLGTSLMSACIVAAQLVMVPMAMLVGTKADAWGRKPLFLIGLLILPCAACSTRCPTTTFGSRRAALDGLAPASLAHFPIIVADLMRGTGRSMSRRVSSLLPGDRCRLFHGTCRLRRRCCAGYSAAFLTLAGIAGHSFLCSGSACRKRAPTK